MQKVPALHEMKAFCHLCSSGLSQVSLLPENDRWSETRAQLLAQMDISMGGRVAEELVFGNDQITTGERCPLMITATLNSWKYQHHVLFVPSTGASSDFDGATKIAQMMVTRFGMSDKVKIHYVTLK